MTTTAYIVRHTPADFSLEQFHTRPLSERGRNASLQVCKVLQTEPIDHIVSSASPCAVQTVEPLAHALSIAIETHDDLRELLLRGTEYHLDESDVEPAIAYMFANPDYALPGGESRRMCEARAIPVFQKILQAHAGKHIVLAGHGICLTLLLASYDSSFDFSFWQRMTKPDVYRAEFSGDALVSCDRIPLHE